MGILKTFENAIDWVDDKPKVVSAALYGVGTPVAVAFVGAAAGAGFEAVGWGGELADSVNYVKACAISGAIGSSPLAIFGAAIRLAR